MTIEERKCDWDVATIQEVVTALRNIRRN